MSNKYACIVFPEGEEEPREVEKMRVDGRVRRKGTAKSDATIYFDSNLPRVYAACMYVRVAMIYSLLIGLNTLLPKHWFCMEFSM